METGHLGIRVVLIEPGDHRTNLTSNRRKAKPSEPYSDRFNRAISRMEQDEQKGPDPKGIAELVSRIVDTPNPRLRYTIGPFAERAAIWLKRLGPAAAVEKAMKSYYSV